MALWDYSQHLKANDGCEQEQISVIFPSIFLPAMSMSMCGTRWYDSKKCRVAISECGRLLNPAAGPKHHRLLDTNSIFISISPPIEHHILFQATASMPAELEEIDKPRDSKSSAVPLVLIHDGGGTIFQYYMLGPLNREVYGIANPYHNASEKPAGGIHELAREYVEAIRKTIGRGPVIVGGEYFPDHSTALPSSPNPGILRMVVWRHDLPRSLPAPAK